MHTTPGFLTVRLPRGDRECAWLSAVGAGRYEYFWEDAGKRKGGGQRPRWPTRHSPLALSPFQGAGRGRGWVALLCTLCTARLDGTPETHARRK
jgi:hypothetical protein